MTMDIKQRIAPNSKESEMMVLGCMLTSINGLNIGADELDDSDFYYAEHKLIFQALKSAYKNDKPADVHLICEELKRQDKLKAVGGPAYITTLAQYAGTSAYIEEYVSTVRDKTILRNMINFSQIIAKKAIEDPERPEELIEEAKQLLHQVGSCAFNQIPFTSVQERFKSHEQSLEKYRGKKILGLRVKTIPEFNEKMLGLRKLILLAAAPNVGKTALTIQLGAEILLEESDACLVYVSLEMTADEIFTRMMLYFSELPFNTYVLGSTQSEGKEGYQHFFSSEEFRKIESAKNKIHKFHYRLQILDASSCSTFNSKAIIDYANLVKEQAGCKRAVVIIDYLQVWPLPQNLRFSSDLEADKWRMGEIKKIRDALNEENQDPVIVISEARKPSGNNESWGGELSDIMGTARQAYTPDAVLLLNPLKEFDIKKLFENNSIKLPETKQDVNEIDEPHKHYLASHGISLCSIKLPKGRDGMHRFKTLLAFNFLRNRFEKVDMLQLRTLRQRQNEDQKSITTITNLPQGHRLK